MRLGLVPFLNARPLDYGFRNPLHLKELQKYSNLEIKEDVPSALVNYLINGDVDVALVSSVEIFRNHKTLSWSKKLGVCSNGPVISVLYIRSKGTQKEEPIDIIYTDSASRSSVALWQCLYLKSNKNLPKRIVVNSKNITQKIQNNSGAILIGDPALNFLVSVEAKNFEIFDLGEWWFQSEKLPFVYALWSYPKNFEIEDEIFQSSYNYGKKNLRKIISLSPLSITEKYLTKNIYYEITENEIEGIEKFKFYLNKFSILE